MNVVLTAPSPTSNTPTLPAAGAISVEFFTARNYIINGASNTERARNEHGTHTERTRNGRPMLKRFFGKLGGKHDLAVSMVGLKLGDTFLQLGCGDGGLLAALASKVGLTGRAAAGGATPQGAAPRA